MMKFTRFCVALLCAAGLVAAPMTASFAASSTDNVTSTVSKNVETTKKALPAAKSISLNKATADELTAVPGIGPKTAEAIVQYRKVNGNFESVDDLKKIKGIGEKTLQKIAMFFTL
ncbi:MAG: helix-hairpin-helix domain-containing protein [Desulforhopalus sp.]|nr:helix-hairpin-helix domain-containing protein [Desulforhopalus sp.]